MSFPEVSFQSSFSLPLDFIPPFGMFSNPHHRNIKNHILESHPQPLRGRHPSRPGSLIVARRDNIIEHPSLEALKLVHNFLHLVRGGGPCWVGSSPGRQREQAGQGVICVVFHDRRVRRLLRLARDRETVQDIRSGSRSMYDNNGREAQLNNCSLNV